MRKTAKAKGTDIQSETDISRGPKPGAYDFWSEEACAARIAAYELRQLTEMTPAESAAMIQPHGAALVIESSSPLWNFGRGFFGLEQALRDFWSDEAIIKRLGARAR